MKSLESLLLGVVGGLIVSEIIRQYEPLIGYIIYAGILLLLGLNIFIYFKNRVKIKIIKQNLAQLPYNIKFEAVNLGDTPNSLEEKVVFKCLLPNIKNHKFPNGQKYKCEFRIKRSDRLLEPHKPKIITATTNSNNPHLIYSWFRKYIFIPSKGMYSIIFARNALDNGISRWRYRYERFLYRLFNMLNQTDSVEVE